jgi:hypothetical protein
MNHHGLMTLDQRHQTFDTPIYRRLSECNSPTLILSAFFDIDIISTARFAFSIDSFDYGVDVYFSKHSS